MILLALETTRDEGSVALADCAAGQSKVLAFENVPTRAIVAGLLPAIERVFNASAFPWKAVEAIAVTTGPGSFTGIRVGMATAKGLAEPRRLPIIAVSSLALVAMRLPQARSVLSAGRGDFYAGEFSQHGQCCSWERWLAREELLAAALLPGSAYITPEADTAELLQEHGQTVLLCAAPNAAGLAEWAARRLARPDFDPRAFVWETADGNYLRRPAAHTRHEASQ